MVVTTFLIAIIFMLAVALVVWQETKHSKSLTERMDSTVGDISQPDFIFEKLDAKIAENRQKRLVEKYKKPGLPDLFRRLAMYNLLLLIVLYFQQKLLLDNWPEVILYISAFSAVIIALYYFAIVPDYFQKLEEDLPRNIQMFSQEITYSNHLDIALANTKNYAHPEFSRICASIASMHSLGMSIEQAVIKMLPGIKSESLVLFFAALVIHDRAGGRLNVVIKNLAELFHKQNHLDASIKRAVMVSKVATIGGVLMIPIFFFILKTVEPEEVKLFWTHPTGIFCSKIIIGLYLVNLVASIYFMRSERL